MVDLKISILDDLYQYSYKKWKIALFKPLHLSLSDKLIMILMDNLKNIADITNFQFILTLFWAYDHMISSGQKSHLLICLSALCQADIKGSYVSTFISDKWSVTISSDKKLRLISSCNFRTIYLPLLFLISLQNFDFALIITYVSIIMRHCR